MRDSKQTRTNIERHGAMPSQTSSPASRARPQTIVSRIPPTSTTNLARWKTLSRIELSSEMPVQTRDAYCCKRGNRVGGQQYRPKGNLVVDTRGHKRDSKPAWCRLLANLFSGQASAPSNDRVVKSSLRQHLRRSWRDGRRYFVETCGPKCKYGAVLAYRC